LLKRIEDLHKIGIIHNDIKPDNVTLTFSDKDKAPRISLIDLGISKFNTKEY